jgi:aminobenzoyl-glutamate transport protein
MARSAVQKETNSHSGMSNGEEVGTLGELTEMERKAMRLAVVSALIFVVIVAIACIPENSFLRNENGTILGRPTSPFLTGIVVLITLLFFIPAVVYGKNSGAFRNHRDICDAMAKSMASMGSFLALAFVSAQFINYFSYTQIGTLIAVAGANFLERAKIGLLPLMILFVLFSAFMNLFMGSASAKWNILAPVFVPMFMLLGYSPELCQLAYRIGDSCTNVITPMMTYYAVILTYVRRYDKEAGIGTVTAMMVPYSITFLIGWTLLLVAWIVLRLPIGIGAGLYY